MLLILTVGTGTAGRHSNVAAGLAATVDQLGPRRFWLVPSSSELSWPVADLIRESVREPAAFAAWSEATPYRAIGQPDDLLECRAVLREVIDRARAELEPGEALLINPTGGTKQMSAGATLAALDAELGEIVFTTGQRADGVVVTGTEELKRFDTSGFFLERDLAQAEQLFRSGACFGAARLLEPRPEPVARRARAAALCLREWLRFHYQAAAEQARGFSATLPAHLERFARESPFSARRLGDLFATANQLAGWGRPEESLAHLYRGAEQLGKHLLAAHGLPPQPDGGLPVAGLEQALAPTSPVLAAARAVARGKPHAHLGLRQVWEALLELREPAAGPFFHEVYDDLAARNQTVFGHGWAAVEPTFVHELSDRLRQLVRAHASEVLDTWHTRLRPRSLLA